MRERTLGSAMLAIVASLVLAGTALGAATISNGSFEEDSNVNISAFMPVGDGSTVITGWTVGGGGVDWIGTYWPAYDGTRSIDMNASPSSGSLSQTLSTTVNYNYVVSFFMAGNPTSAGSCPYPVKTMDVSAGSKTSSYSFDTTGHSYANMGWTQKYFYFQASGSSTVLTFQSTVGGNCGPALDLVTITEIEADGTQCKNGGWQSMTDEFGTPFKNQGDCVSYYATDGKNLGAG